MEYSVVEKQEFQIENVLSVRKKVNMDDVNSIMADMNTLISEKGAKIIGPIVNANFSVEIIGKKQIIDIEIMMPLDKTFSVPNGYRFKKKFFINDAIKVSHIGNSANIPKAVNLMNKYMEDKDLTPITVAYNVVLKEPTSPLEMDTMLVD